MFDQDDPTRAEEEENEEDSSASLARTRYPLSHARLMISHVRALRAEKYPTIQPADRYVSLRARFLVIISPEGHHSNEHVPDFWYIKRKIDLYDRFSEKDTKDY